MSSIAEVAAMSMVLSGATNGLDLYRVLQARQIVLPPALCASEMFGMLGNTGIVFIKRLRSLSGRTLVNNAPPTSKEMSQSCTDSAMKTIHMLYQGVRPGHPCGMSDDLKSDTVRYIAGIELVCALRSYMPIPSTMTASDIVCAVNPDVMASIIRMLASQDVHNILRGDPWAAHRYDTTIEVIIKALSSLPDMAAAVPVLVPVVVSSLSPVVVAPVPVAVAQVPVVAPAPVPVVAPAPVPIVAPVAAPSWTPAFQPVPVTTKAWGDAPAFSLVVTAGSTRSPSTPSPSSAMPRTGGRSNMLMLANEKNPQASNLRTLHGRWISEGKKEQMQADRLCFNCCVGRHKSSDCLAPRKPWP